MCLAFFLAKETKGDGMRFLTVINWYLGFLKPIYITVKREKYIRHYR
jgi:hypothetical protein